MQQQDKTNLLYFYDLPDTATSVRIAELLKNKCQYELQNPAQFLKDITKPFANAMVRINDSEKLEQCANALRYFDIDGKQCRALRFDRDLLGANRSKLIENSVFVRKLPEDLKAEQLHQEFSKFGEIKSLKISLNPDHTSRRYGFICFATPESAQKALKEGPYEVVRYAPKDKREFRKVFNNIYVKNFPMEWTEEDLKQKFGQFGNIKSLFMKENPEKTGKFAFVCYESPDDPSDKEYGIRAAMEAVKQLNGQKIDETHTLYVKEALKASEREIEKKKEMIRYKNSKKRCNLYVKNFPPTTTAEELKQLFGQYGTIENIKLFPQEGNALYAFVCFEKPEDAFQAKTSLHNQPFNGKQLYINHYEIKELRKIQNEDIRDKTDFQNYKKQNSGYTMDLLNKPEVFALLNHLLSLVQPKLHNMFQRGGQFRKGGQRPPMPGQPPRGMPGQPGQPGQQPRVGQPMPQMPGQPPMMQRPPMGMPNPAGMPPMGMQNPAGMPPQMPGGPMGMPGRVPVQAIPVHIQYIQQSQRVIPAVDKANPNYKAQVGEIIYEYVEKISGEDLAPKITGMLIDLPIEDIKAYLSNYNILEEKVKQAEALLREQ